MTKESSITIPIKLTAKQLIQIFEAILFIREFRTDTDYEIIAVSLLEQFPLLQKRVEYYNQKKAELIAKDLQK